MDFLSWFVKAVPEESKEVLLRLEGVKRELKNIKGEFIAFKEVVDNRFEAVRRRFETLHVRGSIAVLGIVISILLAIGQFLR